MVGQGKREQIFYLHPIGKDAQLLFFIQGKQFTVGFILRLIPVGVKPPGDCGNGREFFQRVKINPAKYHTDFLFAFLFVGEKVLSEQLDGSTIPVYHIKHRLERGTFSSPIFPDKPHDSTRLQMEGDIPQGKARIKFGKMLD